MSKTDLVHEVTYEEGNQRIDKLIAANYDTLSRSYIQKLIKESAVFVNGDIVKANFKVIAGQQINIRVPEPVSPDIMPENIPLDILYEDDDIIIINKAKGMVVHPAAGHYSGTIVNALMHHCSGNLSGINGVLRPGIVHRIDMNTTGILVACKNDQAHNHIALQLKEHTITRKYNALVYRALTESEGRIEKPIGRHPTDRKKMAVTLKNGKTAVTHYHMIENFKKHAHIECSLETGRTHQIRVHMASINHPLIGDTVYGPSKDPFMIQGQALHARVLGFIHPRHETYMEFESPLPEYFKALIDKLRTY